MPSLFVDRAVADFFNEAVDGTYICNVSKGEICVNWDLKIVYNLVKRCGRGGRRK